MIVCKNVVYIPNMKANTQDRRTKFGKRLEKAIYEVAAYLRGETVPGMRIYNLESLKKIDQPNNQQSDDKDHHNKNSND